jgi:hypothetical protein
MWLTSIQVSPQTIGLMVDEFRWIWATECIFFWLEVIAGYAFYRYAPVLPGRMRLALLGIYSIAGWGSLFWINGILSWQLTPGLWTSTHEVWDGFFNPTFWPSLLFRTVVCGVLHEYAIDELPTASWSFDWSLKDGRLQFVGGRNAAGCMESDGFDATCEKVDDGPKQGPL